MGGWGVFLSMALKLCQIAPSLPSFFHDLPSETLEFSSMSARRATSISVWTSKGRAAKTHLVPLTVQKCLSVVSCILRALFPIPVSVYFCCLKISFTISHPKLGSLGYTALHEDLLSDWWNEEGMWQTPGCLSFCSCFAEVLRYIYHGPS